MPTIISGITSEDRARIERTFGTGCSQKVQSAFKSIAAIARNPMEGVYWPKGLQRLREVGGDKGRYYRYKAQKRQFIEANPEEWAKYQASLGEQTERWNASLGALYNAAKDAGLRLEKREPDGLSLIAFDVVSRNKKTKNTRKIGEIVIPWPRRIKRIRRTKAQ